MPSATAIRMVGVIALLLASSGCGREDGTTALMRAAQEGNTWKVRLLCWLPCGINTTVSPHGALRTIGSVMGGFQALPHRDIGWTALHYAVKGNHRETVEALLDHGADPNLTGQGAAPLSLALEHADLEIARLLLSRGARMDVDVGLSLAVDSESEALFQFVLPHVRDIDQPLRRGESALIEAVRYNKVKSARLLIQAGARVDQKDRQNGWTPLRIAQNARRQEIVDLLKAAGADDGDAKGGQLILAARLGHHRAVEQLLRDGTSPEVRDEDGHLPLIIAAQRGHLPIVKSLLAAGADIDAKDRKWGTALTQAAMAGHTDVVAFLIQRGANVKDATSHAVAASAQHGRLDALRLLLKAGADPNGAKGEPILWASRGLKVEAVRLLLQSGADPNQRDPAGNTPLSFARKHAHAELIALLEAHGAKD